MNNQRVPRAVHALGRSGPFGAKSACQEQGFGESTLRRSGGRAGTIRHQPQPAAGRPDRVADRSAGGARNGGDDHAVLLFLRITTK